MILYPTETIYGLGVNPFNEAALEALFELKGRTDKKVSWLVRDINDIGRYAEISDDARRVIEKYMPGPLTLVLPAKNTVPESQISEEGTIGFRISSDPLAEELIRRHYAEQVGPLTCTSANISGMETKDIPTDIIEQFKANRPDFEGFDEVIDGGKRSGTASTVVQIIGDKVDIFREGEIAEFDIRLTAGKEEPAK